MTCCPRRSASDRTRAGAARSSTRSRRRRGARVLDVATGTGMVAAELLLACGLLGRRHRPERRDARRRARALRRRRARRADRRTGRAPAVRRRQLRRADVHLPAALRRRSAGDACASSRAWSSRAGASPRWSSACRRWRPRGLPGGCTRRSACRRSAGWPRASGPRSGAFSARAFAASTRATRVERIVGYWNEAGLVDVSVRRMSLGGGIVMAATKDARAGGDARGA